MCYVGVSHRPQGDCRRVHRRHSYRLNSAARCWAKAWVKFSPPMLWSVCVFRTRNIPPVTWSTVTLREVPPNLYTRTWLQTQSRRAQCEDSEIFLHKNSFKWWLQSVVSKNWFFFYQRHQNILKGLLYLFYVNPEYLFPAWQSCSMLYANRAATGSWINRSTWSPAASAASLQNTHTGSCHLLSKQWAGSQWAGSQRAGQCTAAHLKARFCVCANSNGTVMTASLTSEPSADWAVSVNSGDTSQSQVILLTRHQSWSGLTRNSTFHFTKDEFGDLLWWNILQLFSRCNLIISFSASVHQLRTTTGNQRLKLKPKSNKRGFMLLFCESKLSADPQRTDEFTSPHTWSLIYGSESLDHQSWCGRRESESQREHTCGTTHHKSYLQVLFTDDMFLIISLIWLFITVDLNAETTCHLLPSTCFTRTTVLAAFRTRPCFAAIPTICRRRQTSMNTICIISTFHYCERDWTILNIIYTFMELYITIQEQLHYLGMTNDPN